MSLALSSETKDITGIGGTKSAALAALGITTINDLLYYFPRAYEPRGNVKPLIAAENNETAAFILTINREPSSVKLKNNIIITKFTAFDDTAKATIVFFNQSYLKTVFKTGSVFRFYGKITKEGGMLQLTSPCYEPICSPKPLLPLFPIYPASEKITSNQIHRVISYITDGLDNLDADDFIPENLPFELVLENGLCSRAQAIRQIHEPKSTAELDTARRRLIYEELYFFAKSIIEGREKIQTQTALQINSVPFDEFTAALPYELTDAQKKTINDIFRDMTSKKRIPMERLVCGDVGSGKTVCAAAAIYLSCKNGYQSALMAPTEILARQHYNDLKEFFEKFKIKTELLIGATTPKEKKRICEGLESGEINFVIGTHALITDRVKFKNIALAVCDEEHRFGVKQREELFSKGENIHTLTMTATPIPRTLALVIFGETNVSTIDTLPPGRQKIDTFVVDESYRTRLNYFIKKEIDKGRQVYVVCPAVEEGDDADLLPDGIIAPQKSERKTAVELAEELGRTVFNNYNVQFLHGKMKSSQKEKIMLDFVHGKTDILVSTTVIEVGVNVPNAALMIIEDAQYFGLSQIHQLRGRVGRGKYKSYCILVCTTGSPDAKARLEAVKNNSNGYKVAEFDLAQRGPGDFIKNSPIIRQHGDIKFRLAGLLSDEKLLYKAFADAEKIR